MLYVTEESKRSRLVLKINKSRKTLLISQSFDYLLEVKRALDSAINSKEILFTISTEEIKTYPGQSFTMWYGKIGNTKIFASNISEKCIIILIKKLENKISGICKVTWRIL